MSHDGGTLIALAALAAVADLIFGSVLAWGLSGGDGQGSVIGGIFGLALLASLTWVMVQTMSLLESVFLAMTIGFVVVGAGVAMYVLGATDDRRQRRLMGVALGVAALAVVAAVGIDEGGSIEGWRPVLIALVPPLLSVAAFVVTRDARGSDQAGFGGMAQWCCRLRQRCSGWRTWSNGSPRLSEPSGRQ